MDRPQQAHYSPRPDREWGRDSTMATDGSQALARALELHKGEKFDEAAALYREALAADAGNPRGLHYYGVLLLQTGEIEAATDMLARATAAAPDSPEAHNNYGVALREQGRTLDAVAAFRAAVALRPDQFDAQNNLA